MDECQNKGDRKWAICKRMKRKGDSKFGGPFDGSQGKRGDRWERGYTPHQDGKSAQVLEKNGDELAPSRKRVRNYQEGKEIQEIEEFR
jgi:hypothetical protein